MSSWVEFATIKQAVPLMAVLEHYQLTGLRRSGRDQWRGCCPLHGGAGQDAFHVNTARQLFHCFSCGAGGTVLDLVAAIEQCGLREAAQKLSCVCQVLQNRPVNISDLVASFIWTKKTLCHTRSGPAV